MLKRFIEQLVSELEMEMPSDTDKGQTFEMVFDPKLSVRLSETSEGIIQLYIILCPLPADKQSEYLQFAMSANLFGEETGRNFLGLDKSEQSVTLSRFIEKEANYQEFKLSLEEFLNYADAWRADTKAYVG